MTAQELLAPFDEDTQNRIIRSAVDMMNWSAHNRITGQLTIEEAIEKEIEFLTEMNRAEARNDLMALVKVTGITALVKQA